MKNTLWSGLGTIVSQAFIFITTILLVKSIGQAAYGQYSLVLSALVTSAGLAALGLGATATKEISDCLERDKKAAGSVISSIMIISALTSSALVIISIIFFKYINQLVYFGRIDFFQYSIACGYTIFMTLNSCQIACLAGLEAFSRITKAATIFSLVSGSTMIFLAAMFGVEGALLNLTLGSAFAFVVYRRMLILECRSRDIPLQFTKIAPIKSFWTFSFPAALSGLCGNVAIGYSYAMLTRNDDSLAEIAVFSAAATYRNVAAYIPMVISRVSTPMVNARLSTANDGAKNIFIASLLTSTFSTLIFSFFVCLFSTKLMGVYGESFSGGAVVLIVYTLSSVLETFSVSYYQFIFSSGRAWIHFFINAIWCAILITAAYYVVPDSGASGLALAYFLAWSSSAVLYYLVSFPLRRELRA